MKFGLLVASGILLVPATAFAQWIPWPPPVSSPIADPWAGDPPPPQPPAIPNIPDEPEPTAPASEPTNAEPAPTNAPTSTEPATTTQAPSPDEISAEDLAAANEPPAPIVPAERYPRSLPKRPQLLPDGTAGFEISGEVSHLAQPMISAIVSGLGFHGALAIGTTELNAGLSLTPSSSQDAPPDMQLEFPTVRSIGAGVRHDLGSDAVLDIELSFAFVGTDYQRRVPYMSLTKKARLSDHAAVLVGGSAEYESGQTRSADAFEGFVDYRRLGASVYANVEANVSRDVSVLASTTVTANEELDAPNGDSSYRTYRTRLALLIAASEAIDVWFGWNIFSSGTVDQKSFSIALDVRRFQ